MKKKLSLALSIAIFAGIIGWLAFSKHCTPPTDIQLRIQVLTCIQEVLMLPQEELIRRVCLQEGLQSDCTPEDIGEARGREAVNGMVITCVKANLKEANMCTESADQLFKQLREQQ